MKALFLQFELAVLVYYSWKSLVCIVLLVSYTAVLCDLPTVRII